MSPLCFTQQPLNGSRELITEERTIAARRRVHKVKRAACNQRGLSVLNLLMGGTVSISGVLLMVMFMAQYSSTQQNISRRASAREMLEEASQHLKSNFKRRSLAQMTTTGYLGNESVVSSGLKVIHSPNNPTLSILHDSELSTEFFIRCEEISDAPEVGSPSTHCLPVLYVGRRRDAGAVSSWVWAKAFPSDYYKNKGVVSAEMRILENGTKPPMQLGDRNASNSSLSVQFF